MLKAGVDMVLGPRLLNYIDIVENENGTPTSIQFKNIDKFNFAFDLIDELAQREPNKLAMLHISEDHTERRFTFKDIKRASAQCANYFKSLGIKKGDRVMLVLKRHYQFWFAMIGLNKLGAIAIPAPNQLQEHDFEYRFNAAGISAISMRKYMPMRMTLTGIPIERMIAISPLKAASALPVQSEMKKPRKITKPTQRISVIMPLRSSRTTVIASGE